MTITDCCPSDKTDGAPDGDGAAKPDTVSDGAPPGEEQPSCLGFSLGEKNQMKRFSLSPVLRHNLKL